LPNGCGRLTELAMKNREMIAPVAAAITGLGTLVCCLPVSFAAAAVTASVSTAVAAWQPWLLGASALLLIIGGVQLAQARRRCARRRSASYVVFGMSAVIVVLVLFFPQLVAALMADWLP
jgi:hypothetical protein